MNKKGISDIITTVLIIMISLGAIALIGTVIFNQLSKSGSAITQSTDCLALKLVPTSCTITTNVATNLSTAHVVVQWASGDSTNLQRIVFLVSDGTLTRSGNSTDAPKILATSTSDFDVTGLKLSSTTAKAAGVIKTSAGDVGTCQESFDKIGCTATP